MKTPEIIKVTARKLRKNMTYTEKLLWNKLKSYKSGIKIYRQKPIFVSREDNGFSRYIIADFYFPDKKLVIEIDGDIHNEKNIYNLDRIKEKLLQKRGLNVIRFTNQQVNHEFKKVIYQITQSFSS